jgi:hypothetical protein
MQAHETQEKVHALFAVVGVDKENTSQPKARTGQANCFKTRISNLPDGKED